MTIPLPNLDDRTYADLVAELRSQIPIEYPAWTDHNPSDTGIILLELLCWLTETTLYRANRVPNEAIAVFLQLLNGPADNSPDSLTADLSAPLPPGLLAPAAASDLTDRQRALRDTVLSLRQRYRAASPTDFIHLVLADWPQSAAAQVAEIRHEAIKRVQCVPRKNLDSPTPNQPAPAHISLVVVPDLANPADASTPYVPLTPRPSPALKTALLTWLEPRRLLTTRHHVVGPTYVALGLRAWLYLQAGAKPQQVRENAAAAMREFFHPLQSGPHWQGRGYPFGQAIYISELYQLLDGVPGVDFVEGITLIPSEAEVTTTRTRSSPAAINELNVENSGGFLPGRTICIRDRETNTPLDYYALATVLPPNTDRLVLQQSLLRSYPAGATVEQLTSSRLILSPQSSQVIGLHLEDYELVAAAVQPEHFFTMEQLGHGRWQYRC